jgi:ribonucleoside-diphosphate reductase beta chain
MSLSFDDEPQAVEQPASSADVSKRVHASDKRMINATTDVNQLVPFKYKWAWQMYLDSCNNHWMPAEYKMGTDLNQVAMDLITTGEQKMIERVIGSLVLTKGGAGDLAMHIYRHITAPEARQYILRQGFEEALVPHVYAHIVEKLTLNEGVLLDPANQPTTFHNKQNYLENRLTFLRDPKFRTDTTENTQAFIRGLAVYTCAMKGLFSIVDFVQVLTLGQRGKMPDLVQQFSLMLRDQQTQVEFGLEVIQAIRNENPQVWTDELVIDLKQILKDAVMLELAHAVATATGEGAEPPHQYSHLLQLAANRMAMKIGIGVIFQPQANPFPWMTQALGLQERKNITSTPVVENKVSTTLDWD